MALSAVAIALPAYAQETTERSVASATLDPGRGSEMTEVALALTHAQRVLVQRGLRGQGFDAGPADGVFGPRTRAAISQWQTSRGEVATGFLSTGAAEVLLEAGIAVRPADPRGVVVEAAMGTLAKAHSIARGIYSPGERAVVLSEIAVAQLKAGDRRGADRSMAEALGVARRMPDVSGSVSQAFREIAVAQLAMDDLEGALSTARGITEVGSRLLAFHAIAEAQANAGDRIGASRSMAEALSTSVRPKELSSELSETAKAQAKQGEIVPASCLGTGNEIDTSVHCRFAKFMALSSAVDALLNDVMSEVNDALGRLALSSFVGLQARLQAELGDVAGARRTVQSIAVETVRAHALIDIAAVQAREGDIAGALSTALSIAIDHWRVAALSDIAEVQVEAGDPHNAARSIAEALSTIGSIADLGSRGVALSHIAEAQMKVGDRVGAAASFAEARLNAGTIKDNSARSTVLMDIAEAHARAGHSLGWAGAMAEALSAARSIDVVLLRNVKLKQIAEKQAKADDIAGALGTALSIDDRFSRALALRAVAEAHAKAGEIAEALSIAQTIEDDATRASALTKIADAQLDAVTQP